jgi:serine/threonine protein kinase
MMETVPSGTILHGRYRIESVLGSGGFGHVYLAMDLATQQQYALKEYLVTGASGQEQLQHEATVLSHLHHPNLPAFLDAFIERGRYYVVLNYIEGSDLTDLIRITRQRNEMIPVARVMNWLLAICDAVIFLHNQQPPIIHRDIKPDNIRITSEGTAILVDLGNAKSAADGVRTLFFIRHQGTPGYAPPEQYPGGAGTDLRSDVYALGGTLYFALSTHEPPSVSIRNQSIQQGQRDLPTLLEIIESNPPEDSPEAHAARQFRLGVTKPAKPAPRHSRHVAQMGMLPAELINRINNIIQRSMAMRPKDRYQSVTDFARDLKNVMNALPASTEPPTRRPVDPHSTQPDLPKLFESLQAAKENADSTSGQAQNSAPHASTSFPSPAPVMQICPRCNTALAPHETICSTCGMVMSNRPKPGSQPPANSQPYPAVNAQKEQAIQKAKAFEPQSTSSAPIPATRRPQQVQPVVPPGTADTTTAHGRPVATKPPPSHISGARSSATGADATQSQAAPPAWTTTSRTTSGLPFHIIIPVLAVLVVLLLIIMLFLLLGHH